MLLLGVAFDAEISETRLCLYFESLQDLPEEQVLAAMREAIKLNKFFPRVAEIREIVGEIEERRRDQAQAARIVEEIGRRRLETEEWERDRAARRIAGPAPIAMLMPRVLQELTHQQIEERRDELRAQAEAVSKGG